MREKAKKQLDFLILLDSMKSIYRRTLLIDRSRRENDAEHSWHIAMGALLLAEHAAEPIDLARVIPMLLVHDLVEIYAGDTYCYYAEGAKDKAAREAAAADRLFEQLPAAQGASLRRLWEEFDSMNTPDARYAAAMDRLLPVLNNYMTDGASWQGNHISRAQVLDRVAPIERSVPDVWDELMQILDSCVARGLLLP